MNRTYSNQDTSTARSYEILGQYTMAAAVTGSIPVPAASTAIVAENCAMVNHIASNFGIKINISTITYSMGLLGSANIVGRQLFIEGARLVSWGTGQVWAQVVLSGIGATTAALQTYIIGCLTIEIAKNGGFQLNETASRVVISNAKATFNEFYDHCKSKIK